MLHLNNIKKIECSKNKKWTNELIDSLLIKTLRKNSRLFTGDGTVVQQSVLDQFTEVLFSINPSIALPFNKISSFN